MLNNLLNRSTNVCVNAYQTQYIYIYIYIYIYKE